MKQTYEKAIAQVFEDEGGYTNEATDPGGPTNWGITIHDAKAYWKADATAEDVKDMPKDVAMDIYQRHYADPVCYDDLPPGVDYAVLDYAVNSGIRRSVTTVQTIVGATADGVMGPNTLEKIAKGDPISLIQAIYQDRLIFLKEAKDKHGNLLWDTYGHGWSNRCKHGLNFAIAIATSYSSGVQSATWHQLLINSICKLFKKGN